MYLQILLMFKKKRCEVCAYRTFWVGFHLSEGSSPLCGSSTGGCSIEMHTSPFWKQEDISSNTYRKAATGCIISCADMVFHLIDVGVPHLGEEPEGRRGIWIIYRELDSSLGDKRDMLRSIYCYGAYIQSMMLCSSISVYNIKQ